MHSRNTLLELLVVVLVSSKKGLIYGFMNYRRLYIRYTIVECGS